MPPKRKAAQGTSSRSPAKNTAQDPIVITENEHSLSLNDSVTTKPVKNPRKAASRAATELNVDNDDGDFEDDVYQVESDTAPAKPAEKKPPGKAPARVAKPTNLGVDDDSDAAPVRPAKKLRKAPVRAAPKHPAGNDALESREDDDAGPGATTMEQSLLKQNRASKQHLESFRDELTNSQEKAQKSLAALKRDLLKATASPSQDILNKVRDKLQLTSTTPSSPDKNHVLEQAQKILDLGQSVINTYQAMQKGANRPDVAETMQEWEENKDQVAKLVEYGKKEGQKLVDKMVVPYPNKRNPPLPQRGMGKAQGGDLAAVMFPKTSRIQDLEQTWGVAARNQLRALVSLVNAIPRVEKEVKVKNAGKG